MPPMTEEEIWQLNCDAAEVMGWRNIRKCAGFGMDDFYYDGIPPEEWGPVQEAGNPVPDFVREPHATLWALQWVLRRRHTVGVPVQPENKHLFYVMDSDTEDSEVSESIGVAVCQAIRVLKAQVTP